MSETSTTTMPSPFFVQVQGDERRSSLPGEELRYDNVRQIPGLTKIVVATVSARLRATRRSSRRDQGPARDYRQEALGHEGPQVDRTVRCVRASPSAATSRCVAIACGSSPTVSRRWRCRVSATSVASTAASSTATATCIFGLSEQVMFLEIDQHVRSTACAATSRSSPPPTTTRRVARCSRPRLPLQGR